MKREEFFSVLENNLKGIPKDKISVILTYYDKLIDSEIKKGKSEQEIIASFGDLENFCDKIQTKFIYENPPKTIKTAFSEFNFLLNQFNLQKNHKASIKAFTIMVVTVLCLFSLFLAFGIVSIVALICSLPLGILIGIDSDAEMAIATISVCLIVAGFTGIASLLSVKWFCKSMGHSNKNFALELDKNLAKGEGDDNER